MMSTTRRFLVGLAVLLLPLAARAQNSIAYRLGVGAQFTCSTAVPTHITTRGTIWCKSTDSNKLYYTNPAGVDTALGAGGSTPTLSAAYAAGASGTDSTFNIDSTRLGLKLLAPASALGTILSVRNNGDTSSMLLITDNSTQQIKSFMADGASAESLRVDTSTTWSNTTAKILRLMTGGTEKWSFTPGGVMNFIANSNFTGASSATNTTALTLTPNVADGASSVGLLVNNATTLSNATASMFSLANNGTRLLNTRLNSTDGVALCDGGGSGCVKVSTANGNHLVYNGGADFFAGAVTASMGDGTGLLSLTSGNLTLTIFQGVPDADGTRDWGLVGTRWRVGGFKRIVQNTQNMSFSATPAFDCTGGNIIHIGTITANVTGPTMVAGSAGERCTIVFLKDGTAGTYTISGWGSNTRTAGTMTFTATASTVFTITFVWDDRLGTAQWVETSRTGPI